MITNWKTSLAGVLAGICVLFAGPGSRLQGNTQAPPVTPGNVLLAAAATFVGLNAKDHDK